MGDVIQFRTKKLTGFIPETPPENPWPQQFKFDHEAARNDLSRLAEPIYDNRPCDTGPESA